MIYVVGVKNNMQRLGEVGLNVHFTELDIGCAEYGSVCGNFTIAKEQQQAQLYAALLQACLDVSDCKAFQTWGMTDNFTWRGSSEYPLPYSATYGKNLAYTAMADTLRENNTCCSRCDNSGARCSVESMPQV
jgi:endo-1,4-beta-xylanase